MRKNPQAPKHRIKRRCWPLLFAALLGFCQLPFPAGGDDRTQSIINCAIQEGACTQMVGNRKVTLEITPRPVTAMQDLTFTVTVDGPADQFERPYIDLNMPAMDMGRNRVPLTYKGQGVFQGRGVIVRCMSNLKTWQAKITFPDLGRAYFVFDVEY